jgi:hypothetical protein
MVKNGKKTEHWEDAWHRVIKYSKLYNIFQPKKKLYNICDNSYNTVAHTVTREKGV